MSAEIDFPSLNDLDYIPYLDETGQLPESPRGKIGVYAIFDSDKVMQLVAYSRDVYSSLKQHLVRKPQSCYWFKLETIERPSRTILEGIQKAWIKENGSVPAGNDREKSQWHDPIDAKVAMTEEEKVTYKKSEELGRMKLFKKVARRVEADKMEELKARGVQMEIRFNPKLKEQGLLDLKP